MLKLSGGLSDYDCSLYFLSLFKSCHGNMENYTLEDGPDDLICEEILQN